MTAAELITKLQKMPPDTRIMMMANDDMYLDEYEIEAADIKLFTDAKNLVNEDISGAYLQVPKNYREIVAEKRAYAQRFEED